MRYVVLATVALVAATSMSVAGERQDRRARAQATQTETRSIFPPFFEYAPGHHREYALIDPKTGNWIIPSGLAGGGGAGAGAAGGAGGH